MIPRLCVMQEKPSIITILLRHNYIIITQGSIITHYYLFQSPELADG